MLEKVESVKEDSRNEPQDKMLGRGAVRKRNGYLFADMVRFNWDVFS